MQKKQVIMINRLPLAVLELRRSDRDTSDNSGRRDGGIAGAIWHEMNSAIAANSVSSDFLDS